MRKSRKMLIQFEARCRKKSIVTNCIHVTLLIKAISETELKVIFFSAFYIPFGLVTFEDEKQSKD